ncbi:MAG TPA: rhomboid family intramembrane serine protease [Polyangiaceae bacterium]|nr:rhomboid family intramembrane serine protease [Polyangiaceae bacterium]
MQEDGSAATGSPKPPPPEPSSVPSRRPPKQTFLAAIRGAPASALIVLINGIVFVLAERTGRTTDPETLIRFGAAWRTLVWEGQYYRLFTSMFLHIGVFHLFWNGYYGFQISAQTERGIGAARFLALYLMSGVAGSAVSVIGHDAISAGASGALFGLLGCQLMLVRVRLGSVRAVWKEPALRNSLKWIGAWFVVGALAGFDNFAHAGGLAFGVAFAHALAAPPAKRRLRIAATLAGWVALVALSLRPLPGIHGPARALRAAYDGALPDVERSTLQAAGDVRWRPFDGGAEAVGAWDVVRAVRRDRTRLTGQAYFRAYVA